MNQNRVVSNFCCTLSRFIFIIIFIASIASRVRVCRALQLALTHQRYQANSIVKLSGACSSRVNFNRDSTINSSTRSRTRAFTSNTSASTSRTALYSTTSTMSDLDWSSYLEATSSRIKSKSTRVPVPGQTLNVIIGNEAGDADSIISALALSYVKDLSCGRDDDHENNGTVLEPMPMRMPVVSIPRDDMSLRRDVTLLLGLAGVDIEQLIFLDDEGFTSQLQPQPQLQLVDEKMNIQMTLVDHNKLRSTLQQSSSSLLSVSVVEILDHHKDEEAHVGTVPIDSSRRNIAFRADDQTALVGSTCTLVVEQLRKKLGLELELDELLLSQSLLLQEQPKPIIDYGLGLALLGVILLDTMNMNEDAAKGTKRDQDAIDFLMQYTNWEDKRSVLLKGERGSANPNSDAHDNDNDNDDDDDDDTIQLWDEDNQSPNRARLYEYLRDSKFDRAFWQSMSARDAMRIDYKRFEFEFPGINTEHSPSPSGEGAFGLSSVLLGMDHVLSKPNFRESAMEYMREVNVPLLGILTMVIVDDVPKRELLLVGLRSKTKKENNVVHEMVDYLINHESASFLDITMHENDDDDDDDDDGACLDSRNNDEDVVLVRLQQGNPKGSRKQVAPTMLSFFS